MSSADSDPPLPGLRERKKARTQAAIQREALRLFRERGYDATTVDDIAAAAEVSPSTFFRYFPSKEDVVIEDLNDPLVIEAFKAQPAELSPGRALANAMRQVFSALTPQQIEEDRERQALIFANPALRARMINEVANIVTMLTGLIAERTGRSGDDLDVRIFSGALLGMAFGLMLTTPGAHQDSMIDLMEIGLERLENGIRL